MKRFSEQLHKKSQTVKLQATEKRELRERLVSYMEYHPLPANLKADKKFTTSLSKLPQSDPFMEWIIPFKALFKYSSVFAMLILVVIPFVAERAVPGDALYAVKVQFNEELRGTLTFDSFEKVEWETERLNRRIAEARLLASEGRLTAEAEADVAAAVRVHTANAQREIDELRIEDADSATIASIALDTTLEMQSDSFKTDEVDEVGGVSGSPITTKTVSLIASAIDESRNKSDEINASSSLPAYDKLMPRVEQNTTRIYELIQSLEEIAPAEDLANVVRRNDDISRSIEEAIKVYTEGDEIVAREMLIEILQRTQKLIVFINEIEITNTIDIETLIPLVLTADEMERVRTDSVASLREKITTIEEQLGVLESNEDINEKLLAGQIEIVELLSFMSSSSVSFPEFKLYSEQAHALADDILLVLEPSTLPVLEDVQETERSTSTQEVTDATTTVSTSEQTATATPSNEVAPQPVETTE